MHFFSSSPTLIGVDITNTQLKVAIIKQHKGNFQIIDLKTFSLDQENVQPLYKKLGLKTQNSIVATALDAKDLLVRQIKLPLTKDTEIASALEFQLEPLLPYPIENALIQYFPIEKDKSGCHLTVISAKKDKIDNHLSNAKLVNPEIISCIPQAICQLSQEYSKGIEPLLHLHIGEKYATLILTEEGKLLSGRTIEMAQVATQTESFLKELCKAIFSIEAAFKNKKMSSLYLLGDTSWQEKIGGMTQKNVINAHLSWCAQDKFHTFALAIGIAITAAQQTVNFRQKEFQYPQVWKREKKALLTYLALSCLIASAIYFCNQMQQQKNLQNIQHEYAELAVKEGKNIKMNLSALNNAELEEEISALERDIRKRPELYPLLPDIPKVSDILAWMSTHPQIASGIESKNTPINIESFRYVMVKQPNLQNKKEHYQVKIELEFTAANSSVARALHDALLAPNTIVDSKKELQWSCSKGRYQTSFFIKDKTRYS